MQPALDVSDPVQWMQWLEPFNATGELIEGLVQFGAKPP
jgi:hypothetical protein